MSGRFTSITTAGAAILFLIACSHGPEADQPPSQSSKEGYLTPQDTFVVPQGSIPTVRQSDSVARRDTVGSQAARQRRPER